MTEGKTVKKEGAMKQVMAILILMWGTAAAANEIYITQVGDSLDLDIVQDGSGNKIGNSTTDAEFEGDTMIFSITQTGDNNIVNAIINGDTYTGLWDFYGDGNEVTLNCDSAATSNCQTVTLDVDVDGDSNKFYFDIAGTADGGGADISFDVDGDGNIVDLDVDGTNATIDIVLNKNGSTASTTVTDSLMTYTTDTGSGSIVMVDVDGDGSSGHTIDLTSNGGANVFEITQSGVNDNTISGTFTGDYQDVNISQSD